MQSMTGASPSSDHAWSQIDWQQAQSEVRRLQMRIAKAVREKKWGKVKALQWILTHSYNAKLLAVKRVSQSIVTGISRDVLETKVQPAIVAFLTERGLTLSTEKTHITHIDDGVDFLGFNVRKYSGKLLIKPSRKSIKPFLMAYAH